MSYKSWIFSFCNLHWNVNSMINRKLVFFFLIKKMYFKFQSNFQTKCVYSSKWNPCNKVALRQVSNHCYFGVKALIEYIDRIENTLVKGQYIISRNVFVRVTQLKWTDLIKQIYRHQSLVSRKNKTQWVPKEGQWGIGLLGPHSV